MLINYTDKELDLCARLMRAEALAEGDLGMLMVGNVIVNRAIANCLDFKNVRTITDVIYQKDLAKRVLKGEYYHPATNALWFYSPTKGESCKSLWYNQRNSGRYKNHCFYAPDPGVCEQLY